MTLRLIGLGLVGLGVALVVGAGVPQRGFRKLLDRGKRATEEGAKPSIDESYARTTLRFYVFGTLIAAIGGAILLIGVFVER